MFLVRSSLNKMLVASVIALTSTQALAGTTTITFDEITQNLVHGSVLNTQYAGVTISADNFSFDPDLAVIYDTQVPGSVTDPLNGNDFDEDLHGPTWSASNLQSQWGIDPGTYVAGNAVIIQENAIGCGDGVCDFPDDEGTRPSGTVTFDFDFDVTSFGFDLIDFENVEQLNSKVTFFNDIGESSVFLFNDFIGSQGAVYGNNTLNRIWIDTLGVANATKAVFNFGGSGAVDTIAYSTPPSTQVPEPSTLALFGLALLGLGRMRRRA